jgi:hypothetical protein
MVLHLRKPKTVNLTVCFVSQMSTLLDQKSITFQEAKKYITWNHAIQRKFSLYGNNTWILTPLHSFMNFYYY